MASSAAATGPPPPLRWRGWRCPPGGGAQGAVDHPLRRPAAAAPGIPLIRTPLPSPLASTSAVAGARVLIVQQGRRPATVPVSTGCCCTRTRPRFDHTPCYLLPATVSCVASIALTIGAIAGLITAGCHPTCHRVTCSSTQLSEITLPTCTPLLASCFPYTGSAC